MPVGIPSCETPLSDLDRLDTHSLPPYMHMCMYMCMHMCMYMCMCMCM